MTVYEALNKTNDWIKEEFDEDCIVKHAWHYGKCELRRDITRIYKSLDEEVCTNCKYFNDDIAAKDRCERNVVQDAATYDVFGCKLFKMKEK